MSQDERESFSAAGMTPPSRTKTSATTTDGPTALQYLAGILIVGASAGAYRLSQVCRSLWPTRASA